MYEYLSINDEPKKADLLFLFGGITMPEIWGKAFNLFENNVVKNIYIAGGVGKELAKQRNQISEAELIKKYLVERGVPKKNIFIETNSTNTLENVIFAHEHICATDQVKKVIAVSKPFHMRRILATFMKNTRNIDVLCCPPNISYTELNNEERKYQWNRMIGEIGRLIKYAEKGDIEKCNIPDEIVSYIVE